MVSEWFFEWYSEWHFGFFEPFSGIEWYFKLPMRVPLSPADISLILTTQERWHNGKSGQHRGGYRRRPGSTAAAPVDDVRAPSPASFKFMPSWRIGRPEWTSHGVHIWTHTVWYRRRALYKLATPPNCHSAGLLQDTSRLYQRKWHVFMLSS